VLEKKRREKALGGKCPRLFDVKANLGKLLRQGGPDHGGAGAGGEGKREGA